jgi:hypothetical protein
MDWQNDADYAFCETLDLAGWAWQFLRREPAYRTDYAWFIDIWRQLEADYGIPPKRDFFKWKQDPRAWRAEAEIAGCGTEVCPGENDQVLIECWMGAKWGFRKFPPDPALAQPDDLTWREFPIEVAVIDTRDERPPMPEQLALRFDLSLPLPAQLEAAKRALISARQLRAQAGILPPRGLREGAALWRIWLRLLDALERGASLDNIGEVLALSNPADAAAAAIATRGGGYRRILMLNNLIADS